MSAVSCNTGQVTVQARRGTRELIDSLAPEWRRLCSRASYSMVLVGYDTMICDPPRKNGEISCASGDIIDMWSDSLAICGTVMRSLARK